jgi:hypothetical protein
MNIFEKKVLVISRDDESYYFSKPLSDDYKNKVIVLHQSAYADVDVWIHAEEEMKKYLSFNEFRAVMGWINKPQPIFKF